MRRSTIIIGLTSVMGLLLLTPAPRARACSAPICWPEVFWPGENGTLPVNAQALWWTPGSSGSQATAVSELRFTCISGAGPLRNVRVHIGDQRHGDARHALVMDDALVAGDRCEIAALCDDPYDSDDAGIDDIVTYASFTVTEAAEPPAALTLLQGASQWRYEEGAYDGSGDCFAPGEYRCRGEVSVNLSADDVAPWADVLAFDVQVDDDGAWRSLEGPTVMLSPGQHTVVMRAKAPDDSLTLESETHTFTIEECTTPPPDHDAGATIDGGDSIDAGVPRAPTNEGCGCSVAGTTSTPTFSWLGSLVVLAVFGARRLRTSQARRRHVDA